MRDQRPDNEPINRDGALSPDLTQTFGLDSDLSFISFGSDLTDVEQNAIAALPSGSALLLVRSGALAGARYLLDRDTTTIGRHPEADILLDDVTVSRRHAQIKRNGVNFEVVDQRSLNGIYVNGERVEQSSLASGYEVRIGKFRLNFFASPFDALAAEN